MDVGRNRPSRARSRLFSLSARSGLTLAMEGNNWKNCPDELGQRRYSDSEDRPVKPVLRTGESVLLFSSQF